MRRPRSGLFCIGSLLFLTLSCQLAQEKAAAPGNAAAATPPAAATAEVAPAPPPHDESAAEREAVLAHLLRYQRRSGLSERELSKLADTIVVEAERHDFEPALVLAVMHVESRYDTFAVSPVNALGLMQMLPSTGAWLAPQVGVDWQGPQTLFDPTENVRLGVAYLRQLVDRYDGNLRTALLAYNWGPGRIDRRLRHGTPLPREYAQLVFAAYSPPEPS